MTRYRPDIDGLRTLAVLPVLLFHAGIPGFTGGFVGVDVFFVISGFLITSILLKDLADEKFSLAVFYERRARRILPALVAVILFSIAMSWWLGIPSVINGVARSVMAVTVCCSNILFKKEFGYFDSGAMTKPLLHTWSLSVEEQFYIVFPVVLYFGWKYARKYLGIGVFAITAFSFAASVSAVGRNPTAAFYLLHFRAWELGLGSLLALAMEPGINYRLPKLPRLGREMISLLACAGIVLPIVMYSERTQFPGLAALPPCLGTFLLIWANTDGQTLVGRVLSTKVAVGIGLLSYSLYLWHWPLLVFGTLHKGEPLDAWQGMAILGCSLVAAWLSVQLIEKPFREKRLLGNRKHILAASAAVLVLLGCGGMAVSRINFMYDQQLANNLLGDAATPYFEPSSHKWEVKPGVEVVSEGDLDKPGVLLIGDSFAAHWANGFAAWGRKHNLSVHLQYVTHTVPLIDISTPSAETKLQLPCGTRNKSFELMLNRTNVKHVVLASRWSLFIDPKSPIWMTADQGDTVFSPQTMDEQIAMIATQMDKTIQFFNERGCKVWLMLPPPDFQVHVPLKLAALVRKQLPISNSYLPLKLVREKRKQTENLLESAAAKFNSSQVEILDPLEFFCEDGYAITVKDRQSLYFDEGHLSYHGSLLGQRVFDPIIKAAGPEALNNQELANKQRGNIR